MDRIDLFRIFVRATETGSFTKAADSLNLPRSTVSTAIATLETRLRVRLFNRTTRVVSPTQEGQLFYDRCVQLIADVEDAEALFRCEEANPTGWVSTDVPSRIGRLIVAPALPGFLERYPGIQVRLGMTDRAVSLVGENVDCVLRVGPLHDSGLIARQVGELELINVASPAYLARHGTPQSIAELGIGHTMIGYASPSSGRTAAWEWADAGTIHTLPLPARVTVNSAEGYISACRAGLGLIQIPAYDVRGLLAAGELVEILPAFRAAPMQMSLLYPHRRLLSQRVQVFADWLIKLVENEILARDGTA